MNKNELLILAAPVDLSKGLAEFFDSIELTGTGLVTKGLGALLVVIGGIVAYRAIKNPKDALRKGMLSVGVVMFGLLLVFFGSDLFGTITDPTPVTGGTEGGGGGNEAGGGKN